ncbi:MAG: divergent polysaccharide deacetylase family protein [Thermodesulfobacteriota bacterium]
MNRRAFLFQSGSIFLSGFLGPGTWSRAFGFSNPGKTSLPRIALIIDDFGYSRSQAKWFWDLGVPITFAILPKLEKSLDLAHEIHARGHEIMLHQPMEPQDSHLNPGPGAIFVGYGAERIKNVVQENIAAIPYASGVNNHMGSRLTECQREMQAVLHVVEQHDLFFVDSFTSTQSVAYREASKRQLPSARRNVFLDHYRIEAQILNQLLQLEFHARAHGSAIGIGHPYPETSRAIARYLTAPHNPAKYLVHMSMVLG